MKYILLIHADEQAMFARSEAETGRINEAYGAYAEALQQAGVLIGVERLRPATMASIVRVTNGTTEVLDGPYAEAKEQLGGFYMIDVPDIDAALSWAAHCPAAGYGTMEVRPIWAM